MYLNLFVLAIRRVCVCVCVQAHAIFFFFRVCFELRWIGQHDKNEKKNQANSEIATKLFSRISFAINKRQPQMNVCTTQKLVSAMMVCCCVVSVCIIFFLFAFFLLCWLFFLAQTNGKEANEKKNPFGFQCDESIAIRQPLMSVRKRMDCK